ncbi:MAG: UDP-2,3-diacylglucosamine diphosphatase, partial [Bacteroidales bacterium]|nr:UDP-2,3-diacylglucosamine diphosphatase [Bacteroidales bacterium]
MSKHLTYFVSDVHLGLQVQDPARREARFVEFLKGIPAAETEALYLLGDIWDFWYEYKDVVPKGYVRVFSALLDLMDGGVKVYFFPG